MNEITSYQSSQLPDTLEDLTQFVLVGKAKLDAYMLKLRTVNRLSTAQDIRDQTLKEAQEVSTALIAAEQRIGELLLAIPKATGNQYISASAEHMEKAKTKAEIISEQGYERHEASDYQQMAKNPDVVNKVLDDAIANGTVVTKSQVMKEIAEAKRQAKVENDKLRKALSESETKRLAEKGGIKEVVKTVEVIPEDYDILKEKASRVDGLEKERVFMKSEYDKIADKWKEAEATIRRMNEPEEKRKTDLKNDCIFFCAGVRNFLEKYGGYVYLRDEMESLPGSERIAYESSIKAIQKWADSMLSEVTIG